MCVTVLKQRCRDFGVTRWPYRKVKKLDTIISALQAPPSNGSRSSSQTGGNRSATAEGSRLEKMKKTRELLITQPNCKAHLRVGKLDKELRRRVAEASRDENSSDYSSDDSKIQTGDLNQPSSSGVGVVGGLSKSRKDTAAQSRDASNRILDKLLEAVSIVDGENEAKHSASKKQFSSRAVNSFTSASEESEQAAFSFAPYNSFATQSVFHPPFPMSNFELPPHVQRPLPRRLAFSSPDMFTSANRTWFARAQR